jgi:hypothetical protein
MQYIYLEYLLPISKEIASAFERTQVEEGNAQFYIWLYKLILAQSMCLGSVLIRSDCVSHRFRESFALWIRMAKGKTLCVLTNGVMK